MLDKSVMMPVNSTVDPVSLYSIDRLPEIGYQMVKRDSVPYMHEYDDDLLDIVFGDVDLIINGKEHKGIPMSKANSAIALGLADRKNITIHGPKGACKTTYLGKIARDLSKLPATRVFKMDSVAMKDMVSAEFQTFLRDNFMQLASDSNEVFHNYILLDEAQALFLEENDLSNLMLQCLDGDQQRKFSFDICNGYQQTKEGISSRLMAL